MFTLDWDPYLHLLSLKNWMQVCVEESGSDGEERSGNGRDGNDKNPGDRFPSSHILERRRSYKSQQKGSAYQEHGASYHLGQRMGGSGLSAYREHGMTKPPALFSYHNVQKKSCLVEELEESETEEEGEVYEEEKEELFESEDESEATEEEEEKEASWWQEEEGSGRNWKEGGSGGKKMSPSSSSWCSEGGSWCSEEGSGRKMSPSSSVKGLQAEARRRFSGDNTFCTERYLEGDIFCWEIFF